MAPGNNSQAGKSPATPYDPAYDTLRFDILVVLSLIRATDVCSRCTHTTLLTATRAFEAILHAPSQYPNRGSHIQHVNTDATTGAIVSFTTTASPTPVTLRNALLTRDLLSPSATATLIDRVLETLSFPSDDAPNLSQSQLWFSLAGRYTLLDAVQHRPLAEFARTHMQHLNNICRGRLGHHANQASFCPRGPASSCFGLPMPSGYPYPDKPGRQAEVALRHAMDYLDIAVEEVVEDQLEQRREWPAAVAGKAHADLDVLAAVERLPAFRARMEALRFRDKYCRLEGEMEVVKREWRARGWEGGEGVEDVEETRDMLHELVQKLMAKMG